jgi:hypothetical protein
VELVVAQVERRVDGLEGLEVDVDLALLALCGEDLTTVDNEAIGWDLGVQLEALLGGRNSREDGETVDAGLDVGGGTLELLVSCWRSALRGIQILQPTSSRRARPGPSALHTVSRSLLPRCADFTYG